MLEKEGKNIDAVHHRHSRFHARHRRARLHAARQARLRGEAADADAVGSAPAAWKRRAKYKVATQMGNQGFSHECNRVAAEIVWSGAIGDVTEVHISTTPGTHPTGLQEPPPESSVPGHARLGALAGRRADARLQPVLRAVQLARLSRFRHRARSATGRPTPPGPVQTALQLGAPTSARAHQRRRARATSPIRIAPSCGSTSRRAAGCRR